MYYYCYTKLKNIIPTDNTVINVSPRTTPYYDIVIKATQNIIIKNFPLLTNEKYQLYAKKK